MADPAHTWYKYLLMLLGMLALIILIVFIDNSERRLPVQYAKRVVGRKVYGGQNTYLPIKVNMSGVLPIIFAQSIASMPATIHAFVNGDKTSWAYRNIWSNTSTVYAICYFLLIIFFSYFYSSIQYNPVEIANNMKKDPHPRRQGHAGLPEVRRAHPRGSQAGLQRPQEQRRFQPRLQKVRRDILREEELNYGKTE